MKHVLTAILAIALIPVGLRADSWGSPTASLHVSENAGLIVRIEPGSRQSDGTNRDRAHCTFYRYSEEKKMYELWREHDLINDVRPCSVVIPDDGSFLATFDDYMGVGTSENTVVVYDGSGRMLKKWALTDIFSETEIEKLPHSTMSIHWRGDVGVMMDSQHEVFISAPEYPFKSDEHEYFKGFFLDTKALTIRENPEYKRLAEWQRSEDARVKESGLLRSVSPFWRIIAVVEGGVLACAAILLALQKTRKTIRHS